MYVGKGVKAELADEFALGHMNLQFDKLYCEPTRGFSAALTRCLPGGSHHQCSPCQRNIKRCPTDAKIPPLARIDCEICNNSNYTEIWSATAASR